MSDKLTDWAQRPRQGLYADRGFTALVWTAGLIGFLLPVSITGYLLLNGAQALSWEFISQGPRGYPLGVHGGILPAIKGSLALAGLAMLLAFPAGLLSAIYLAVYARNPRFIAVTRFAAECLAAIPAVLFGVFGYALLVVTLGLGVTLGAGALTLSMMMYPVILVGSHAALQAVDAEQRGTALGLGVSRAYLVRRVMLPQAWPGIVAAAVLAGGHAVGSAAPVLFTASVVQTRSGLSLDAPVMSLPTHLYYLVSEAVSFEHAYGTAFVLIVCLLLANSCALVLRRRIHR